MVLNQYKQAQMDKSTLSSSTAFLEVHSNKLAISSSLMKKHNTIFTSDVFDESNFTIDHLLNGRTALFVLSEKISELYSKKIKNFLLSRKKSFGSHIAILKCGEDRKNLESIVYLCEKAYEASLDRQSPIVGVGGGICLDMCGFAAALFRRGIPHIKIPTTLVGVIDAGVGIKNGVNLEHRKNLLGTFSPPEASVIDASFLETLPLRQIVCGVAESIKMAIIVNPGLYQLWKQFGDELIMTSFQRPSEAADEVIENSIISMLQELSYNLYENQSYQRAVDFGHTFSPHIESDSKYEILHGEAVAIDMAISCQISYLKGLMSQELLEDVLELFQKLQLPFYTVLDVSKLWSSLTSIVAHRNGKLNLVVPKLIGQYEFIETLEDLDINCLEEALSRLKDMQCNKKLV